MSELIPIYSISKPFLAEAVLALNISLDVEIGKHLPNLQDCYKNRLLADLLNHTSGLDDYGDMPEYRAAVNERKSAWSRDYLLDLASHRTHSNQGFLYSNIGYLLLSLLVESETKRDYFAAISELVLDPLGISGFSAWVAPHPQIPDYDPRWVYSGTFLSEADNVAPSILKLAEHREETIGLNVGIEHLTYPNTGFDNPGYGYGFMTDGGGANSTPQYVGHGGGGPGFSLMALVNTENWKADLEYSTSEFDQSSAITSLRGKLRD